MFNMNVAGRNPMGGLRLGVEPSRGILERFMGQMPNTQEQAPMMPGMGGGHQYFQNPDMSKMTGGMSPQPLNSQPMMSPSNRRNPYGMAGQGGMLGGIGDRMRKGIFANYGMNNNG